MYHHYVETHIGQENYVYTNLCNCPKKEKIKDFNSPRKKPLIVLDYWPKKIEEYFHLRDPGNVNLSEKSTAQDVKILINIMLKHVNFM